MSGAAGMASGVKAKSEISLEYKLMTPGNTTPVLANTAKAKYDHSRGNQQKG